MANTIKIGGIEISAFKVGNANCRIYLADTLLYPHVQEPCFAVVDDITQYSDTEFEDVFNNADGKWYKLNNLNDYEQYGVYGSGRTITTYDGKLTVDEVTIPSPSRLPSGYTEVEYIRNSNYNAYINTGVIPYNNTSNRFTVTARVSSEYHSNLACATIIACEEVASPYYGFGYRYKCSAQQNVLEFFGADGTVSKTSASTSGDTVTLTFTKTANSSKTMDVPLYIFGACGNASYTSATRYSDSTLYSMSVVKNNETIRDFIPAKRDSDSVYGLYDLINDVFYTSPNGNNFSGGSEVIPPPTTATCEFMYSGDSWVNVGEVSGSTYPVYYDVIQDPPNNLTFSSMTEAESYECPWVGMKATIDGDKYVFSGDSQSGYEWVYNPSRLPQGYTEVEYIENTSTAYIDTRAYLNTSNFEIGYVIGNKQQLFGYCHQGCGGCTWLGVEQSAIMFWGNNNNNANISSYLTSSENTITFTQSGATINGNNISKTLRIGSDSIVNIPLIIFARYNFKGKTIEYRTDSYMQLKSFYLKNNGILVRDFVPAKRDSDNKYGMYDIVNDVFYLSPNNVDFSGGEPV